MKKNLKNKIALIFAVLLICLYGIFGIPQGVSGKALLAAISNRIHLGLDLQGGVHLILQVQVAEAVSDETDSAAARVRDALKTGNLTYSQVVKPDPGKPELIEIDGTPAAKASDVRSLLDQKFSNEYDINGGSTETSWTLTMKPMVEKDLEQKTVQQAIETIRDRVDSLGTFEPLIAPYSLGENQILVELPGVSDLDKVKTLIQSTARLEIHAVVGDGQGFQDEAVSSGQRQRSPPARRGDAAWLRNHGRRRLRTGLYRRARTDRLRHAISAPPIPAPTPTPGRLRCTSRLPTKPAIASTTTPTPMSANTWPSSWAAAFAK